MCVPRVLCAKDIWHIRHIPFFSSLTSFTKDLEIASWHIARGILLGYPSPVEISLQRNTHTHTHDRMCPFDTQHVEDTCFAYAVKQLEFHIFQCIMYSHFCLMYHWKYITVSFQHLLLEFWPIAESAYVQQNIPKLRAYQLHRRPRTLITSSEAEGRCFFWAFSSWEIP